MADTWNLLVVGDGPVAAALEPMAATLGWSPVVVTELAAADAALTDATAVVVLSHHEGVDAAVIASALAAQKAYVGAMGSRRTQERRRTWLLENGVTEAALADLHAPIGLDIGADSPAEIAVSILAELVAVRTGGQGAAALKDKAGPIHPEMAPGEAECPAG